MLETTHNITSGSFDVYIDNKEIIDRINEHKLTSTTNMMSREYEIYEAIIYQISQLNTTVHWHWIKGNSDAITYAHQINHASDDIAGHIRRHESPTPTGIQFPGNNVTITSNNEIIHSNIKAHIIHDISEIKKSQYLQRKYEWDDHTLQNISWNAHASALKRLTISKRITCIKIINEWNAIGSCNKIIDDKTPQCPICSCTNENHDNLYSCKKIKNVTYGKTSNTPY